MRSLRWLSFLPPTLFLIIVALGSGLVYSSLEDELRLEQGRQQRFVRNAAFEVVDNLGFELFSLYSTFSYDLSVRRAPGDDLTLADITAAVDRFHANARFPHLLNDLVCLRSAPGGAIEYLHFDSGRWTPGPRPRWVPERPPVAGALWPALQAAFSLDSPVFTAVLRPTFQQQGALLALVLQFSPDVIVGEAVPALVGQSFSEADALSNFRIDVIHKDSGMPESGLRADLLVPLLPWTHFESWFDHYVTRLRNLDDARIATDLPPQNGRPGWWSTVTARPVLPQGPGWYMAVTRTPAGIPHYIDTLRWRNIGLSLGFFLVLSSGFLAVWLSFRRHRELADQERTFTGLISHELKTPLAVIRSLSENLGSGIVKSQPQAEEYGKILQEETSRLGRMVQNILLLTYHRSAPDRRSGARPIAAAELARRTCEWYRENYPGTELSVEAEEGLPLVLAQEEVLSAALDNLVGNAVHHGRSADGRRSVRVQLRSVGRRRRGVEIAVQDEGPGMAPNDLRQLFRPFRRGSSAKEDQRPGSGVGLSLVKAMVQSMRGRIRVESQPGRGTTFRLWLPGVK